MQTNNLKISGETPQEFKSPWKVYWLNGGLILAYFGLPLIAFIISIISEFTIPQNYLEIILIGIVLILILGSLWIRFANHNFYIYPKSKKIRIINPHSPFKKDVVFHFSEIKKIILKDFISNRIIFILKNGHHKLFFCDCLQRDYYDEHFVERTFDDFYDSLEDLKINAEFKNY